MTVTAFQSDAFQPYAFQAFDAIPTVTDVVIPREFREIQRGQDIFVTIKIADVYSVEGDRVLFDPNTLPSIQIYNPDGTIRTAYTAMIFLSLGTYGYQFDSLVTDQQGLYTGQFQITNGGATGITRTMALFEAT